MHIFIFQSVPERYDLRNELKRGRTDTWYATRYRSQMSPGDYVFFWMGGDENVRGLYGWGVLKSSAYIKPNWDTFGVDVEYKVRFKRPILARYVKSDVTLNNLLIFKAPSASNFLLDEKEARQLLSLVEKFGEEVPNAGGQL